MLSQNRQLILCAWSSSENNNNNAWIVNANDGNVNNNNKNNNNYVRCVLAFWNKAIIQNICRNSTDYGLLECAGFILKRAVDSRVQETRPGVKQKNGQLILCAWSSSEYSSNNAWEVNANNGNVNNNNKNNNNKYVRCVLAFWDKTNMSVFILPELAGLRSGRVSIFYFQKGCRQPGEETRRLLSQNRQLILCAWSSSEYSNNNAWNVNGSNGWLNNGNNKANNAFYVRCVLAFGNKI